MTNPLFAPYVAVLSRSISKAASQDECVICMLLIQHCENDYLHMPVDGKADGLQELRDQLEQKHEEIKRDQEVPG